MCTTAPDPAARHLLLGTAGHIDHGKTTLIRALTGIDADRLPEEQRRGMTIELGFAHLDLPGVRLGIVDVPGHERFVRTMVAGATAIDIVLLVVAADDAVMPQTREHVDILRLLDVRHGVVALTKADMVDADLLELVDTDVAELLADTPMAEFARCAVSAHTGAGLDALRAALGAAASAVAERPPCGVFRMAIDRVFTIHGRGTVVTGSASAGRVVAQQALTLMPPGSACRVRGLENHASSADALVDGQRAAINLSGVERTAVERGMELATPGFLTATRTVDAHLHVLRASARAVKNHQRVRLCMGTAEHMARVRCLDGKALPPGGAGMVQLHLAAPGVAEWHQRFIIRDETNARTLGGGRVVRPCARTRRPTADDRAGLAALLSGSAAERIAEVIRYDSGATLDPLALACRSGVHPEQVPEQIAAGIAEGRLVRLGDQGAVFATRTLADAGDRATRWLRRYHAAHPDAPGCPHDAFIGWLQRKFGDTLAAALPQHLAATIQRLGRFVCLKEFAPRMSAEEQRQLPAMIAALAAAGFQPPAPAALPCVQGVAPARLKKLLTLAVALGDLVPIAPDLYLPAQRVTEVRQRLAQHITTHGPVTVAEVRTLLDSSRKFVVPMLEYLDRIGYTQRDGDRRRLTQPVADADTNP